MRIHTRFDEHFFSGHDGHEGSADSNLAIVILLSGRNVNEERLKDSKTIFHLIVSDFG